MASHSSTLAWKIPWTEELERLQSMGLLRVGHDRATSLSLFTFMHWRKKGQPIPVFLPGESQGQGSLVGCRLWGCTESDTTEATQQKQQHTSTEVLGLGVNRDQIAQHLLDHGKKAREFQKNIYFCFIDYAKAFDCVHHSKLWKILKEMGIPDHLTYLLKNLYAGQEATVRTGHGTTDWFQIGKGVHQDCILSPCLFNFCAEYIMRNAGLKKHKLESRLPGEISITSDMQMTPPLWQKVKRNSKVS